MCSGWITLGLVVDDIAYVSDGGLETFYVLLFPLCWVPWEGDVVTFLQVFLENC